MAEGMVSMADMVIQMIGSGQLSFEDEARIRQTIEGRQKGTGDGQKGRCLAGVIDSEMAAKMASQDTAMRNMFWSVYKKCFKDSRVGKMDASKLTEKTVNKFEKDVRELYGLDENEMVFFMGMFQVGLDKMAEEGLLEFVHDRQRFRDFIGSRHRISYIGNPYSSGETEKIMNWSELHPTDARGLAVGLWFTGGISLTEIVNLSKKDCWGRRTADSIMQFDEGLFRVRRRAEIVRNALNLHPADVRYVFAIPRDDGSGWKRLTGMGLQKKLGCICRAVGISYKKIKEDEAIRLIT